MNFLAHAVLAGNSPDTVAGSLAGDFVKGVLYEKDHPNGFLRGLRLHRRIDAFSNFEPNLRRSADRLPAQLRRIAPPCIDMMADHFLAAAAAAKPLEYLPPIHSLEGANTSLERYEDSLHQLIEPHKDRLSERANRFLVHAQATQLFSSYQSFDRTARGIAYVCERLGRATDSAAMVSALEDQHAPLHDDFLDYWPRLKDEAERFLTNQAT